MGLVGATRFFIKAPFLVEGIFHGASGSLLAIIFLSACYYGFLQNAGNFLSFNPADEGLLFLPPAYLAGIFLGGIVLGFLGSLTSLKRFIK
jgi:cell division transport system permease protein